MTGGGPWTLATATSTEYSIADLVIDSANVYWATSETKFNLHPGSGCLSTHAILKVPLCGGTVTTLATGVCPEALAVDAENLYWVDGFGSGSIDRMPLSGGTPISLAAQTYVSPLYVSGSNLYWTQIYDPDRGGGYLESVPTAGGATVTLAGSEQDYPEVVAVDDTQVYYFDGADDASVSALTRIPLLGGRSPTSPLGMTTGPYALDATNVYWVSDAVWTCPKGSSCDSPTYLGGPGNYSGMLAIDAESVYWTVWYGAILKTPLAGGPVTTLVSSAAPAATGGYGPFGGRIAVDDTSIYWSTQGAILKAPK